MKTYQFLLCAIAGAGLLVSCNADKSDVFEPETVNVTFNGFEVESGSLSELTRAETTYNLLAVDVKDGSYVQSVSRVQVPMSEALADVTMPLRVGQHKVYIVCSAQPWHNFDESALLVSWNDQTAPLGDTWSAVVDVNVKSGDAQTKSVQLDRMVAYVRTMITDALPTNLAEFRQNLVGGSWCLNLTQQTGDVAAQIIRSTSIPTSYLGNANIGVGLYTFVPSGVTAAASYSLTALDNEGATIQSITFNNVPLQVNRYTNYQGNYFGYTTGFSVSLKSDWNPAVTINF